MMNQFSYLLRKVILKLQKISLLIPLKRDVRVVKHMRKYSSSYNPWPASALSEDVLEIQTQTYRTRRAAEGGTQQSV